MSWFSDAVDSVSNAVSAVPVYLNPFPVVTETVKNADAIKNAAVGAYTTYLTGGASLIAGQNDVNQFLRDPKLSAVTLGLSEDLAGAGRVTDAGLVGRRASASDEDGAIRFGIKYAATAAAITGGVALGAGAGAAGTGYGVAQNVRTGNYAGAVSNLTGIPSSVIAPLLPSGPTVTPKYGITTNNNAAPVYPNVPTDSITGFASNQATPENMAVLAVTAVGIFIVLKIKGKI